MSKKKSGLIWKLILGILIVLVILVVAGLLFIDNVAKTAVVKGVPLVLGDDITASVNRLHIEPLNVRMEVSDLIIGNPEGYSDGYAFKLGEVIADIDGSTITKDKIRIEHLRLKDIDVVYERGLTSSNLDEILSRLEKKEKEEKEEKEKEQKESKEKTFQFDKIEIDNVGVSLKIKGLPGKAPIAVSIDPLENLGAEGEGITALDLTYEILGAIIKKALALDAISDALSSVGDAATALGSAAAAAATDTANAAVNAAVDAASDAAAGAVDAATGAIKGLFGGSKDDDKK